ncbi:hypothetical protein GYMLUDRAFT_919346 [Collybiopsis luxurians FD-317 M1]|uniref:Uncharacterized protein n=1 Tax=Collybiopsis luxurians FD-317 M1 TaxID=944289 RepID=A0A0D0BH45_9AGAR|nr:hypothetical protein GYMLUDRAFT_919346 [Collybiopsis luxurians FD-317 M1]
MTQTYFVDPLQSICGASEVFKKRFSDLEGQMLQQTFNRSRPSLFQKRQPEPLPARDEHSIFFAGITKEQAETIVSDVMTLGEKLFKHVEVEEEEKCYGTVTWRVSSVNLIDKLFRVEVDEGFDGWEVDQDGLIDLLCTSEMLV